MKTLEAALHLVCYEDEVSSGGVEGGWQLKDGDEDGGGGSGRSMCMIGTITLMP